MTNPCSEILLPQTDVAPCRLPAPETPEAWERRQLLAKVLLALHGGEDARVAIALHDGKPVRSWIDNFLDFEPQPIMKGIGKKHKETTALALTAWQKDILKACGVPKDKFTTLAGTDYHNKSHVTSMMMRLRALQNEMDGKTFRREYLGTFDTEAKLDTKWAAAVGIEFKTTKTIVWDSLSDAATPPALEQRPKQKPYVKLPDGRRNLLGDFKIRGL